MLVYIISSMLVNFERYGLHMRLCGVVDMADGDESKPTLCAGEAESFTLAQQWVGI